MWSTCMPASCNDMDGYINDMFPNFSHLVKEHGGETNCRNVQLWLQFCIKTSTITMPQN